MKMFILECTEDELRANRGIMEAIVDACQGFVNGFFGTIKPCTTKQEDEEEEEEDADDADDLR